MHICVFPAKRCDVEGSLNLHQHSYPSGVTLFFNDLTVLTPLANGHFYWISPECCATQSEPPQMFCAGGEREGGRVDGGRGGVPEEEVPEDDRVPFHGLHLPLVLCAFFPMMLLH